MLKNKRQWKGFPYEQVVRQTNVVEERPNTLQEHKSPKFLLFIDIYYSKNSYSYYDSNLGHVIVITLSGCD